jgi:hypothetical protein
MNSSANNIVKILSITVLLLSLTVQLAGQTAEKAQTMEGLRDFAVVVKYGHVDGQQEDWQPILLPRLEDRARESLWEAGIPISQSRDEAGNTTRPRLVFTIDLRRTTVGDPVRVEAQIFQRVRLWRDSAKELELATWTMDGVGGPMVTEKMVWDVFNGQLDVFLKTYREVNTTSSQVSTQAVAEKSAQSNGIPNTFEGLNGTGVFVSVRRDIMFDGRPPVSQKLLQEAAETKLKEAGIKVIRYADEAEQAGHANLYVWVKLSPPNVQTWAPPIGIESTFSQWVRLVRDPKKHSEAVTWKSQDSGPFAKTDNGTLVITDQAVLEVVNRQLDEFIKAFKAASPPPQKAQKL